MKQPFHKRTLDDWYQALQSEVESQALIQELIDNCGVEAMEKDFIYRCRLNLKKDELVSEQFDAPSLEIQTHSSNRFQPSGTNCLFAAYSENIAVLETLPSISEPHNHNVIYAAQLTVHHPFELLDLTNSIGKKLTNGNREWDYKPIFGQMFFVDDQLGYTNIVQVTRLLSELAYRRGLNGIKYLSRCHYTAKLKEKELSFPLNYVIYGSPIQDGRLSFNADLVQKYAVNRIS